MSEERIRKILEKQREFFRTGATKSYSFRMDALKKLSCVIKEKEQAIFDALKKDLGKGEFESRSTETNMVLEEIHHMRKNLKRYMKTKRVGVSMLNLPASGKVMPEPYGVALIFSAWNYPFQLLFSPLVSAVAAGNCVMVKTAEQSGETAKVCKEIIEQVFPEEFVACWNGGRDLGEKLLKEKYDFLFYTGGINGGKAVMASAAESLTPLVLELGGKSPCIVDEDAKLPLSAKRIVWGKFLNAGQTCVAPDYILVHESIKEKLLDALKKEIIRFYGEDASLSEDYPRIVSKAHCQRLAGLLQKSETKIVYGGKYNIEERFFEPTLIDSPDADSPVMGEEIFGPILPVLGVKNMEEAIDFVIARAKPLALYYFSHGRKNLDRILSCTSSGGVCVNETIMHFVNQSMPFGGVGASGFGSYHGKYGFDAFTHYKAIMLKGDLVDMPVRYPPGLEKRIPLLKMISR
ncbi:MAG: aldehyde dehydrogenase [Lentisphaeria bacterium]|nr:aldehyde dehydrogenase [Lentisphaeria bacterium]